MSESLFDQVVNTIFGSADPKRPAPAPARSPKAQQVTEASARNRADLERLTTDPDAAYRAAVGERDGYGGDTASEAERDFRRMSPLELEWKYGNAVARDIREAQTGAAVDITKDATNFRSNSEAVGDFALSTLQGFLRGGSGLVSLGLSGAGEVFQRARDGGNRDEGLPQERSEVANWLTENAVGLSQATEGLSQQMDSLKSDETQRAKRRAAAASFNAGRDSQAQYEKDLASGDRVTAELARFGRDFVDSLSINTQSNALLSDITGDAAGSLALDAAGAATGLSVVRRLADVGGKAGKVARGVAASGSIAAQESGGAYQQAANEALAQLQDNTDLTQDEKIQLADAAGQISARTQAPVAAVTGILVSRLVAGGVGANRIENFLGNLAKEGLEETIQSGSSAIAVNRGLANTVNPDQDLLEGVGADAAGGLLGGIGAGAIGSTPGAAVDGVVSTAKVGVDAAKVVAKGTSWAIDAVTPAVTKGVDSITSRYERVKAANAKASPVSSENVKAELNTAAATFESAETELVDAAPESQEFARNLYDTVRFNPETEVTEDVAPIVQENLADVTDRMEAVERLTAIVESSEDGSNEQLSASRLLVQMVSKVRDVTEATRASVLSGLEPGSAAQTAVTAIGSALSSLKTNNSFKAAFELAQTKLSAAIESGTIRPVEANEVGTLEGQSQINNALAVAEYAPEKASLDANQKILEHADSGLIQLTPVQRQSLLASSALIQAERDRLAANEEQGLSTTADLVSGQIISDRATGQDAQYPSLSEHVRRVTSAYRAGDTEAAAEFLQDLMLFAQHMQNKVDAYNQHMAEGGGRKETGKTYKALTPKTRRFVDSLEPAYVQPASESSVRFAQTVAKEAELVGRVAAELAEVFGDLGVQSVPLVQLDERLVGDASEVAKRNAIAKRTQNSQKASERAKQKQQAKQDDKPAETTSENTEQAEQAAPERTQLQRIQEATTERLKSIIAKRDAGTLRYDFKPKTIQMIEAELERRALEDELFGDQDDSDVAAGETASPAVETTADLSSLSDDFVGEITSAIYDGAATENGVKVALTDQEKSLLAAVGIQMLPGSVIASDDVARLDDERAKRIAASKAARETAGEVSTASVGTETNIEETVTEAVSAAVSEAMEDVIAAVTPVEPETAEAAPEAVQDVAEAQPAAPAEITEPEFPRSDVRSEYPNLALGENNLLVKSFILQDYDERNSNLAGSIDPLRLLWSNLESLSPALASAYEGYLENVGKLTDDMQRRLTKFLKQPYAKSDPKRGTNQENFLSGAGMGRFARGRALHLTEMNGDQLRYNPELLETAAIAAVQWVLLAKSRIPTRDFSDMYQVIGVDQSEGERVVGAREQELLVAFQQGLTTTEASRSLADMIQRYWGFKTKSDAPIGDIEGISEAIAKEMLESLVQVGLFEERQPVLRVFDKSPFKDSRSPLIFVPKTLEDNDPLRADLGAIERAVVRRNRQRADWVGAPPSAVAKTQLHNSRVELTTEQRKAIRARQNVPFKLNSIMLNFIEAIGEAGVLELFAGGQIIPEQLNAAHQATLEGRNTTFRSALESVRTLVANIRRVAEEEGKPETDVPVYFEYTFNSMNRLQMLGANSPQSSKLMREVLLPTQATVDMSLNGPNFVTFMMAIGQHVGLKIEKTAPEVTMGMVLKELGTKYAGSVAGLQAWLRDGGELPADVVATLKAELGGDISPVAVHSLMDYARWLNTDIESRKSFETALYIEADGKTNGPINGMALFTVGEFSAQWVENMWKGGLSVGEARPYHEHETGQDLYQTSSDILERLITDARAEMTDDGRAAFDQVMKLLSQFFGKDIVFDGELLEFGRGISKNPLTVTLYGSQAAGIANKITKNFDRLLTERMSQALQLKAANPQISIEEALFPNASDPVAEYAAFSAGLQMLTGETVQKIDFANFSLAGEQFVEASDLIQKALVEPMQKAIEQTVGKPVIDSLTRIRMATQVQSLILAREFRKAVEAKIAEKKAVSTYNKASFLSRKELDEIFDNLKPLAPIISTGNQNFFVANSQVGDLSESEFSATLEDKLRTSGFVEAPADAGVRGIPAFVIGSGDGTMMQIFASMNEGANRTLDVFDGLNVPLDAAEAMSRRINKAVWMSWNRNPMTGISSAFDQFLENVDFDNLSLQDRQDLSRALFNNWNKGKPQTASQIKKAIAELNGQLKFDAMEIEARHNALARVDLGVDQMAAVGAPHTETGKISLAGLDAEQKAAALNELFAEELNKLLSEEERIARNEAKVLSPADIRVLADTMKMSKLQKALLNGLLGSIAALGYRVVQGDLAQVNNWLRANNLSQVSDDGRKVNGFLLPDVRVLALVNASPETLVHELIHAATFDMVRAYYAGQNLGTNAVEQARAIERIEKLMNQFLGLDVSQESQETQQAYLDAKTTIESKLTAGDMASAVNEFMAWGLANQNLAKLQSKTAASKLALIAKNVIAGLRKLIFGGTNTTNVMTDMLSNLRFNTEIIAAASSEQVTDARAVFEETVLYHSQAYGNDARVEAINQAFNRLVAKHLKTEVQNLPANMQDPLVRAKAAEMLANSQLVFGAVRKAFPMTPQQSTTFGLLLSTMKTAVEINPNALEKAGELYSHFTKTARVETFMADPDADDQNDRYQAREKFQLLLGNRDIEYDKFGRSSLMPMFLALAMVNPEMQEALRSLPLPANTKNTDKTVDAMLENAGTAVMDRLGSALSGQTGSEKNLDDALQALTDQILRTADERRSWMSVTAGMLGNGIDQLNDFVAQGLATGSKKVFDKAGEVRDSTDNVLVKTGAQAAAIMAGVVNRDIGSAVADQMISEVNRVPQIPAFVRELMNDLIGRTESNAPVFDLIKRVRNWVQQRRQQFREHLPKKIMEQFSRELTDAEWTALYRGMGKADISALRQRYTATAINDLFTRMGAIQDEAAKLEAELAALQPKAFPILQRKAQQLATFMMTGRPGSHLLKNAEAISGLYTETKPANYVEAAGQVQLIDMLTTLYALSQLAPVELELLSQIAATEADGVKFTTAYLDGLRKEELRKSGGSNMARLNYYKGYIPAVQTTEGTVIVASDSRAEELLAKSYVRVGNYVGSDLEQGREKMGYYMAPVNARGRYQQGVLQVVQQTAGGADILTGLTHGRLTSGVIDDPVKVRRAFRGRNNETATEPLVPVLDVNGVVVAYERSVAPDMLASLSVDENIARAMGVWRGRQVEEEESRQVNGMLIERLKDIYDKDMSEGSGKKTEYVNLFDAKVLKADPILRDTMASLPGHTIADIAQVFGNEFWVRRDMLNDALGYRDASVRNVFDNNSRLSPQLLRAAEKTLVTVFGNDAFKYAVKAEDFIKNLVTDLRVLIVVKSVIVPAANLTWNVIQLATRGVPITNIAKGFAGKVSEVSEYMKTRERLIDAEAELRAAEGDVFRSQRLQAEIQEINDRHRRLSIWPLIEAGELTSISDSVVSREDMELSNGRLVGYFEGLVDRLPPQAQTLAKYGMITKDTALFKGLQRSIEYGDFLGKAVLYEDLVNRQGKSVDEALAIVSEEFVNYDRLPGRSRGYIESIGLLWFWHFKLRSTKVAVSMIRNNPVHAMMTMALPFPDIFGPTGSPITDNALALLSENKADYSIGPEMGLNAIQLNPVVNLLS